MADNMEAPLVVDALKMALARRRPPEGLIHHSDQGSQGEFNRSLQHSVNGMTVNTHSVPRLVSSSLVSCADGC